MTSIPVVQPRSRSSDWPASAPANAPSVGRRPNTEDLCLKAAGIETDDRGYITVNDQCCTTADGVWAVGDCNGRGAFTHTSWNDHEVVVANLFDNDPRSVSDRIACYGCSLIRRSAA